MDDTDLMIINELQKDGRLTNQELSERVNLSPSPCLRRVRSLEERGVIKGYTALVNQKELGLPVTVFIRISLQHHDLEHVQIFEDAIRGISEILDCYLMTGKADYLLRVAVADLEAYEKFMREKIHHIPGIASIDTSFAYGVVKQTHTFS
ncbi:Lrp/AsnC family transcriptional regulator [Curvivirga aplysinae]|uniref:Lrp/AsnC family transcriptional regulator n=1 Tax=Curvivirga aplysinae TaxID=2529852 RepID=UPI0012BD4F99|nr:Lrp/AsnC family transcriptional regulator [Curvivirga aplysinae]MTI08761.1 Lrp/AsnC family transcriptional regulator [Curvivirga aplysinae]